VIRSKPDKIFARFKGEEGDLIPILQQVQERDGYISTLMIEKIAHFLRISENQIYGVASFYSQFRFNTPGRNAIKVCLGTACHVLGGQILCDTLVRELEIVPGETTPDGRFDLERVACLGCCALSPVIQVNEDIYSRVTANKIQEILAHYE